MRILKTYYCVARNIHWCDRCCRYIMPGEYYRGSVELWKDKFLIFKYHENPCCDFPPDPDYEGRKDKNESSSFEWKKAA